MATVAEASKKVSRFSYSIQHFLCLDRVVRAVVLHCVLEVRRHHPHHYRAAINRPSHVVMPSHMDRACRMQRRYHSVLNNA